MARPITWAVVYVSDYVLTITSARLYRTQHNIVFEGSYEITPVFQKDVDALRTISPRFVITLVASMAYVWLVRRIAPPSEDYDLYPGVLGALFLLEAAVHVRHLRNLFVFGRTSLLQGRLVYDRCLLLRMSSLELLLFAGHEVTSMTIWPLSSKRVIRAATRRYR